jgi:hypothetical protein
MVAIHSTEKAKQNSAVADTDQIHSFPLQLDYF